MLRPIIFFNFFNKNYKFFPRSLNYFLNKYLEIKLNLFTRNLKKKGTSNSNIKIIVKDYRKLKIDRDIQIELLSNYRINLNRINYINIRDKIIKETKENLKSLYKISKSFKNLSYKKISIPEILEFDLIQFFNETSATSELINQLLQEKNYDRLILFNCNPNSLNLFRSLNNFQGSIEVYYDKFLKRISKLLTSLNLFMYIFRIFSSYIKNTLTRKSKKIKKSNKKNIIFIAVTKNQINCIKPIYHSLKLEEEINPILYSYEEFVSLNQLTKLLRFLLQIRQNLIIFDKKMFKLGIENSNFLKSTLKILYDSDLYILLIKLFSTLNNLKRLINNSKADLILLANDFLPSGKLAANYLKIKNIPTLFIPHAAIPILPESISSNKIRYFALGGEYDKDYYLKKGVPEKNIIITGIPRYEHFYKKDVKKLIFVKDMFSERIYNFELNKFTILLTTNPIDDKANEKIIKTVVKSLRTLNLINNLIIKLHPRENGIIHKKVANDLNCQLFIVKDYDILALIKSSDILISQKSTTLLEAMIVRTPVLILDFINKSFTETSKYEFLNEKYILTIKDQKSLTQEIEKLISNRNFAEKYTQELKNYSDSFSYYDVEEPPTQKIVNLILRTIN